MGFTTPRPLTHRATASSLTNGWAKLMELLASRLGLARRIHPARDRQRRWTLSRLAARQCPSTIQAVSAWIRHCLLSPSPSSLPSTLAATTMAYIVRRIASPLWKTPSLPPSLSPSLPLLPSIPPPPPAPLSLALSPSSLATLPHRPWRLPPSVAAAYSGDSRGRLHFHRDYSRDSVLISRPTPSAILICAILSFSFWRKRHTITAGGARSCYRPVDSARSHKMRFSLSTRLVSCPEGKRCKPREPPNQRVRAGIAAAAASLCAGRCRLEHQRCSSTYALHGSDAGAVVCRQRIAADNSRREAAYTTI